MIAVHSHENGLAFMEDAAQDFFGEGILEETLDRAAHRARAVERVVSLAHQEFLGLIIKL